MKLPFGKTKMQKFESVLAALRKRGELLASKRITAQAAFDNAITARQQMLIAGDLDDQKLAAKLQSAVDSCGSTLSGIDDAISVLQAQTNDSEAQLAAEQERVRRVAASEALATNIANIEKLLGPWLQMSRDLASALEAIHWRFESTQMAAFVRDCASQVEAASSLTSADLQNTVASIRDGTMAIPSDHVEIEPVPEPEPERLEQVFSLHATTWIDSEGQRRRAPKWSDIELPPQTAERALRLGICVPLSDPRRRQLVGMSPCHPEEHWCKNLDAEPEDAVTSEENGHRSEPVQHTAFTVVDRGPAITLRVAR
jgi:hypothetical protein